VAQHAAVKNGDQTDPKNSARGGAVTSETSTLNTTLQEEGEQGRVMEKVMKRVQELIRVSSGRPVEKWRVWV
jgi:hypothetical protein